WALRWAACTVGCGRWRQGPSCPSGMGQDRRARTAKFGTAVPCRVATLGKGREASGARPQPETARERTWTYVTEPDSARTQRRAAYRPAPLLHGRGLFDQVQAVLYPVHGDECKCRDRCRAGSAAHRQVRCDVDGFAAQLTGLLRHEGGRWVLKTAVETLLGGKANELATCKLHASGK